jgi:hypothetical protein
VGRKASDAALLFLVRDDADDMIDAEPSARAIIHSECLM